MNVTVVYAAFKGSGNNYRIKHSNVCEFLNVKYMTYSATVHHVRAPTSQSNTNAGFDLFFIPNTLALNWILLANQTLKHQLLRKHKHQCVLHFQFMLVNYNKEQHLLWCALKELHPFFYV